jgi:para-aminobenzoate synthetase/4-amino-4-deoxychorismate lyase
MKSLSWMQLEGLLGFLSGQEDFVFLDTSRPDRENHQSLLFVDPVERLRCQPGESAMRFLQDVEGWLGQGYYLAGWFDYDFGRLFEDKLAKRPARAGESDTCLADLGVYRAPRVFDHITGDGDFPSCPDGASTAGWRIIDLQPNVGHLDYLAAIRRLKEYIAAGDTYQVNYTLKLLFSWHGSPEALYCDLRHNQTVAYGAYIRRGAERILSFSPELFFRRNGLELMVRPMKGTSRRGGSPEEDQALCQGLHEDQKNRSENVMIVDLLRNDLARLMHQSGGGDVWVSSLFDVETYESLLQMTSTVRARLHEEGSPMPDLRLLDLFHTLFPCGSVTGAPKIRTMEIIDELENERRGVYTGAIGFLGPGGQAAFSVPIRTVVLRDGRGEMGIGSGIIHDSDPEQEWRECLLKGRFLSSCKPGFQLFETLLWQADTGYWFLKEHLERLAGSASQMYFLYSEEKAREELDRAAASFCRQHMRVRLALAKDGSFELTAQPCDPPGSFRLPPIPPRPQENLPEIEFSRHIIDKNFPWLLHKTTRRDRYDEELKAGRARGLYEMVFCNERGEVTEGCITNIIIYSKGVYTTPPTSCGLLPGVMRRRLLQDKDRPLQESLIGEEDVQNAEAIFLCNSVRGLVRVALRERREEAYPLPGPPP